MLSIIYPNEFPSILLFHAIFQITHSSYEEHTKLFLLLYSTRSARDDFHLPFRMTQTLYIQSESNNTIIKQVDEQNNRKGVFEL